MAGNTGIEKRGTAQNALIWFGAAVSIAEIYTGTLIAPLGLARGMAAVIAGHAIGGLLMYMTALIGGISGRGAMESVKLSFGEHGAKFFAALNVLQLVGWTAVMIIGGSISLGIILGPWTGLPSRYWCVGIGLLIAFWIMLDMKNFERVNKFSMALLFMLSLVLTALVFMGGGTAAAPAPDTMSFASAMELSVAMPLSWLPLISDYMRDAKEPKTSAAVSTAVYTTASCWMYFIGIGTALYTGGADIAQIMAGAGLGVAGILIVAFSTVTTTFLDAYSGGISFHVIFPKIREKAAGIAVCGIGTLIAILGNQDSYETMLYLISSVFAPMAAVMITDFFILKKNYSDRCVSYHNLAVWAAGFALYRWLLTTEYASGATLPVFAATMAATYIAGKLVPGKTAPK